MKILRALWRVVVALTRVPIAWIKEQRAQKKVLDGAFEIEWLLALGRPRKTPDDGERVQVWACSDGRSMWSYDQQTWFRYPGPSNV